LAFCFALAAFGGLVFLLATVGISKRNGLLHPLPIKDFLDRKDLLNKDKESQDFVNRTLNSDVYLSRLATLKSTCQKYGLPLRRDIDSLDLIVDVQHKIGYCRHGKVKRMKDIHIKR